MSTRQLKEGTLTSCASALELKLLEISSQCQYASSSQNTRLKNSNANHLWLCECCDVLAQVVVSAGPRISAAFVASSPLARLYADCQDRKAMSGICNRIYWKDDRLINVVKPEGLADVSVALSPILWWLRRCNLPISFDLKSLSGDVRITAARQENVVGLVGGDRLSTLDISEEAAPFLEELALSGVAFASLSKNPSTYSRLRVLSLRNFSLAQFKSLSMVPCLEELHIHGTMGRFDIDRLESAWSIRKLYVASNELLNISGLAACPRLELLSAHSSSLKNILGFKEATKVSKIVIIGGAMSELPNFGSSSALESISVPWCRKLVTVSNLRFCFHLRKIVASGSGLTSLEGLNYCPVLESVDFSNCEDLLDLSPLAGAPQLRTIIASSSAVKSICGLGACRFLSELDVSWCSGLEDLSPVAGAPRLRSIKAACSGVRVTEGLSSCKALEYVNFNYCDHLSSLSALAGAPALGYIYARGSGVCDVRGLELCPQLKEVDLSRCERISNVPTRLARFFK